MTEPPNTEALSEGACRPSESSAGLVASAPSERVEALLATVRFRVGEIVSRTPQDDVIDEMEREVRAALDTIASELEQYERVKKHYDGVGYTASWERASLKAELERRRDADNEDWHRVNNAWEAAEAELKRARVERDSALHTAYQYQEKCIELAGHRDRAVEALREITRRGDGAHPATREHWLTAKRALAEIEESG